MDGCSEQLIGTFLSGESEEVCQMPNCNRTPSKRCMLKCKCSNTGRTVNLCSRHSGASDWPICSEIGMLKCTGCNGTGQIENVTNCEHTNIIRETFSMFSGKKLFR